MVALKQSCCRKQGFKRGKPENRGEHRNAAKNPEKLSVWIRKNMLSVRLSTEARCFSLYEVKLNVFVCGASWANVRR